MDNEFFKYFTFWITTASSVGTFIVAIVALVNLWIYRKEKIEGENVMILKDVIRPLKSTLEEIIKEIPKGNLRDFAWNTIKKDYPHYGYLLSKRHKKLAQKIKDFNCILKKFRDCYHLRWNELKKLFYQEISNYLHQQSSPEAQRILENLYKQSGPEDDEIVNSIKRKIEENITYRECFEVSREVYNKACKLKEELENFVKRMK